MKIISSTRKPYLLAAGLTLCIAAGAGLASAATDTPPFVQTGSVVTTPGASGTYNGATFQDGANPYTVTISPASGQTATLNNGSSIVLVGDGSTITVASGITIDETAGGTGALDITGGGTVTNAGSVTSTSFDAIDIGGAGTVNNSGTVTGENFGINIGGAGTVTSSNSIVANGNTGIFIGGDGTVNLTGTLTAENYGIYIGSDGTVTDSNTLTANGNTGINIIGTGTVTLTGEVTAENYGVNIGGDGTVTNSNVLTGQGNDAVFIGGNGTVTNTGSMISNHDSAIVINGVGNVTNSGLLQGDNHGVSIGGSSTVFSSITNSSTGTITGITAIEIDGLANVTNAGSVTSTGNSGIIIQGSANGTSTVNNSGTVLSTVNGIYISNNNAANVTNSGTVSGTNYGVEMNGTGAFTNNGGAVTGGINGVYINGFTTASTVNLNAGSVTGTANDGLYLDGASTVTLQAGASVSGGNNGIYISGSGSVTDNGSILAHNNVGIYINDTGTLAVLPSGTVTGAWNGIQVNGSGSLINTGTIIGQGNLGVYFGGTGALTLPGGSISGPGAAIYTNNAASSVAVIGRANLVNGSGGPGLIYNSTGIGSLNLNIVGLTPAELASFNAQLGNTSGDIVAGGEEYTWQNFLLSGRAVSLEQAVDPGLMTIATRIDNLSAPLPLAYDSFYAAAALGNPEAALNSLVGREFDDALGVISKNDATALSETFDSRAFDLRAGTGGFDLSGLNITSGSMIASLGQTSNTLDRLMGASALGGTTMSDSKEVITPAANTNRWGAWASGTVTLADESATDSGPGFHYTTGSPTIGADYRVCNNFAIGALLNYSTTGANFGDGSRLGVQTGLGALYGTWSDGPWYVNGLAGGGYSSYDNHRVTLTGDTASSSPDGDEVLANLTGGYDFKLGGGWTVSPEGGFLYTHVTENGYTESGAGAYDLTLDDQNIDSLRSKLGFRVMDNFKWDGIEFTPQIRASWYHEILDDSRGVTTNLGAAPALGSFTVQTNTEGRDFADLGAGLSATPAELSGDVTFFVNYDAQVGQDNFIAHTVNGGVRVNF